MPFDSIFLANQLAGNKRATLAYVPDVDLLHWLSVLPLSHAAAALLRSSKASTVAAAIRAISGISSSGRWPARSRATRARSRQLLSPSTAPSFRVAAIQAQRSAQNVRLVGTNRVRTASVRRFRVLSGCRSFSNQPPAGPPTADPRPPARQTALPPPTFTSQPIVIAPSRDLVPALHGRLRGCHPRNLLPQPIA